MINYSSILWFKIASHFICLKTVRKFVHSKTISSLLNNTWGLCWKDITAGDSSHLKLLHSCLGLGWMTRDWTPGCYKWPCFCCLFREHMTWVDLASSKLCSLRVLNSVTQEYCWHQCPSNKRNISSFNDGFRRYHSMHSRSASIISLNSQMQGERNLTLFSGLGK